MVDEVLLFFEQYLWVFIVLILVVTLFTASDIMFLMQFHNKALWYQYWKYNIDDTKYHLDYNRATWFGKIVIWGIFIIPRLIILTPLIILYIVGSFIFDILSKLLYKR